MWNCIVMLNVCRGFVGLLGALAVVIGVIMVDSQYDNYGRTDSTIGNFFFFGGWILFACSIGLLNDNLTGLNFTFKALLGIVGSVLVIAAAALSQLVMYAKNTTMMRVHLIFFVVAWMITAYAISLPTAGMASASAGQWFKFIVGCIGALGVIGGMVLQMMYRKRGFEFITTGKPSAGNSYSPGLPVFTAGWLFVALANALI